MTSTVNLSKVNLSIQEFQKISSGEYNAGEVKLTSATTLGKINDRVTMRWLNKKDISHEEVLAIKQAFIKALSDNGVDRKEINRIRRELGLAPDNAVDRGLRERSIRPLTRQQVREILDRNADTINLHNANNPDFAPIRTSAEIYGEGGMRADRAARRDAVNATLSAPARQLDEHRKVSLLQAIIADDVDFRSEEDRAEILRLAEDQLAAIMRDCHCRPRNNVTHDIDYTMRTGQKVSLPFGTDEAAFALKLENMIVRLRSGHSPRHAEFEVRDQFRELDSAEEKNAFLDTLSGTSQGGFKARVIAVQLLGEAGVGDYGTLALVNQLSDQDAIRLARHLVTLGANHPTADSLRNDQVIRELAQKPGIAVEDSAMAYIPATSASDYNTAIRNGLASDLQKVFPEFLTVLNEVAMEIRSCFGEMGLPDGTKLSAVFGTAGLSQAFPADDFDPSIVRATPDGIRAGLLDAARTTAAERMLRDAVQSAFNTAGGGKQGEVNSMVFNLRTRHPDMMERLKSVRTPAEAKARLAEFGEHIAGAVRLHVQCRQALGKVGDWAREGLAAWMGVPASVMAGKAIELKQLTKKAEKLMAQIEKGEVAPAGEDGIEAAFRDLAGQFVEERVRYLKKVDALNLPADVKDEMKANFLLVDKIEDVNIDFIVAEAARIDVGELEGLLRGNRPKEQVYAAMRKLSNQIDAAVLEMFAHKEDIGPDDTELPSQLFVSVLVQGRPNFKQLLDIFFFRADVRGDDFYYGDADPASAGSAKKFHTVSVGGGNANEELAGRLGTPALSPLDTQALIAAVRAEVPGEHSAEEALAFFAPGTNAVAKLAQLVKNAPGKVTPSTLCILARGVLRGQAA